MASSKADDIVPVASSLLSRVIILAQHSRATDSQLLRDPNMYATTACLAKVRSPGVFWKSWIATKMKQKHMKKFKTAEKGLNF